MSNWTMPAPGAGASSGEEQVRRLLEMAGRRPDVPAEELAMIKAAARARWQEEQRERQESLARLGILAAVGRALGQRATGRLRLAGPRLVAVATVLAAVVAVGWWWWGWRSPGALRHLASVETVAGTVTVRAAGDQGEVPRSISVGETIPAGAELETASHPADRTALRLVGGASVRVDGGSRVRLASATVIELVRGAVYVDSGAGAHDGAVEVRTPLGVARDFGTQFEVRLLRAGGSALRVRVREGMVVVEQGEALYSAVEGVELTLHSDGSVSRKQVPGYGPEWAWILHTAPRLDVEGRTLREFLGWVGRETGWQIRFAGERIRASADEIILHGAIGDLTPDQASAVVLPGAGLTGEVVDGTLVVAAAENPAP